MSHVVDKSASRAELPAPVLVVEDDADLRDVIVDVLRDQDVAVAVAANGKQALDRLIGEGMRPSVILLDMMMPVMDGWRFREAMLRHPELAEIPVVVMTAHADAKRVAEQIGAAGSLAKPVNVADLLRETRRSVVSALDPAPAVAD